ncbi:unnamed protein product [Rotaria sp. Silwood1]|nr:unnamed protein product [Rotaria sp. Silwood1]CAF4914422.1 unnamed protein product [Rotaria sp. Silwood1]
MDVDSASLTWVLISAALVWIMIPGIGLFYSGMTKRKSALSLLWLSLMTTAVTSFQWFAIGYSLSFSLTGSRFIGNFAHIVSMNILNESTFGAAHIPHIAFYIFQLMFAITSATSISN